MLTTPNESSNIQFTPWLLLHSTLVAVMVASISWGLKAYISLWGALPVALAISVLFSKLSALVIAPWHSINFFKRGVVACILLLLFALSGGLSYATIYTLLFAESNGTRYLDTQISQYKEKLGIAIGASVAFSEAMNSLGDHSNDKLKEEVDEGGSCPMYRGSGRKKGPIAGFRANDAAMAERLKEQIAAQSKGLNTAIASLPKEKPAGYEAATAQLDALNVAVREFNTLRANPAMESLSIALNTLEISKIPGGFDCGDSARQTLIQGSIAALKKLQKTEALAEVRPGIDLDDEQAVTSRSLLRGITLVSMVPPISWFAQGFGINTSFADDPLMRSELRAKGILNFETLPLFVSALLELTIILTARFAYDTSEPAFKILNQGQIDSIGKTTGLWGVICRSFSSLLFVKVNSDDVDQINDRGHKPAFFHKASDPEFENREKGFAIQLLPWTIELDWGTYLVIPDLQQCERHYQAAEALIYERLAEIVAHNISWENLGSIRYALDRREVEKLYGDQFQEATYHIYRLSKHFAQIMRLEILKNSTK